MATSKKKMSNTAAKMQSGETAVSSMPNPFPGMANPMMGNMPSPPGFNVPPFGAPMQGGPMPPQGMMPPMPGTNSMQAQGSSNLFASVGNMLRLGVDTINAALAGSNQIIQAFAGSGYHTPSHYPHGQMYHHGYGRHGNMHHCCGHNDHYHNSRCDSCCDVYGENHCNPSVNGCC